MAIVAQPRFVTSTCKWFDGLIGIFPFVTRAPAIRNSINRDAGTMETKPILSITGKVIKKMMLEKVLPAIKAKFPVKNLPLFIQMDNAGPHTNLVDKTIEDAGKVGGWDIRVRRQPANSPDLNILDLGFFNSIQSIQHTHSPQNITEMIEVVEHAFYVEEKKEILNDVFLTLQKTTSWTAMERIRSNSSDWEKIN